jgi:hypothetical protein
MRGLLLLLQRLLRCILPFQSLVAVGGWGGWGLGVGGWGGWGLGVGGCGLGVGGWGGWGLGVGGWGLGVGGWGLRFKCGIKVQVRL